MEPPNGSKTQLSVLDSILYNSDLFIFCLNFLSGQEHLAVLSRAERRQNQLKFSLFFQANYQPKLSPSVQDSSGSSTWLPQLLANPPPRITNSLTDIAGLPRATIHGMSIMHPADTTHPITWDLHQNLQITQTFVFGQLSTTTQTAQTLD